MDENSPKNNFGIDDFIAFAVVLLASCIIGIYFAYKDRKDSSMSTYFFGGKQMHPVAVGLSMAVTFQSSIAVIAEPTEAYIVGNVAIWYPITSFLAFTLSFFYFMPAFYTMDHGTIFEYLQIRFNTYVAKIAAITNTISTIFYMGLVVYAPATVLNAVTPISLNWSIVLTSVICTFYTALGGMKAVMWTDVFQSGIMIIGIISVFIQGLIKIGGFGSLFEALERGERYTAGRFDYGLISRISPLALLLGGVGQKLNSQGLSQQIVQRYQSCKSLRHAQYAALFYIVPTSLIFLINVGNGLVMYAYFEGCDPVKSGEIEEIDQGVPYMTLKLFADIPAMSGIFVAAVFSGSLSTISSGINSFSMVIVEDFITPCSEKVANSDTMKIILGKTFGNGYDFMYKKYPSRAPPRGI
uniref:sodium-coupled monocarboxylate transporter 2-like n=1 Tax=Styela clava TaxID=7725 RepID=UPI00193A8DBF|nr:sodium-coupled monocarboxylate transporter 2-like [Styela clava]